MKYIFLLVLFTLSYCSSVPEYGQLSDMVRLEELRKKYPDEVDKLNVILARKDADHAMFDMRVHSFIVADSDPLKPASPTAEQKARARVFTAKAKRYMLRTLDLIRFIINTPEFQQVVLNTDFYSSRNATGPWGTIKVGDKLDSARLLEVLEKATYRLNIVKRPIASAVAVAVVGPSYYVSDLATINKDRQLWIGFPSHDALDQGRFIDGSGHANAFFHEMLHNLGFNHVANLPGANVPYGLGGILESFIIDKEFQAKYGKDLAGFRPFYEDIYQDLYITDSHPVPPTAPAVNFMQQFPEEDLVYDTYDDIFAPSHR